MVVKMGVISFSLYFSSNFDLVDCMKGLFSDCPYYGWFLFRSMETMFYNVLACSVWSELVAFPITIFHKLIMVQSE